MIKNIISAALGATVLSACTTPAPTYRNLYPASDNARILFESDFELHTHFSARIDQGPNCGKFEPVGYLLKADSIFIYDKPNLEISIDVPSKQIIGVTGYHKFSDPAYKSNCHPKGLFFTPKPNQTYIVKMNKIVQDRNSSGNIKGICFLSIDEIGSDGQRINVAPVAPPACN